ncbi:hypothetical protein C8J57DRAFT_1247865 [Mycena rebaudengoi]|nr:hypothetical protein C8J57DRAFT_1247865 [Mycena rebaudengoi]
MLRLLWASNWTTVCNAAMTVPALSTLLSRSHGRCVWLTQISDRVPVYLPPNSSATQAFAFERTNHDFFSTPTVTACARQGITREKSREFQHRSMCSIVNSTELPRFALSLGALLAAGSFSFRNDQVHAIDILQDPGDKRISFRLFFSSGNPPNPNLARALQKVSNMLGPPATTNLVWATSAIGSVNMNVFLTSHSSQLEAGIGLEFSSTIHPVLKFPVALERWLQMGFAVPVQIRELGTLQYSFAISDSQRSLSVSIRPDQLSLHLHIVGSPLYGDTYPWARACCGN